MRERKLGPYCKSKRDSLRGVLNLCNHLQEVWKLSLNATSGPDKSTALIRAIASANLDDVTLLLDSSCDIDKQDDKGYNALSYCMIYGYKEIAIEIMRRGALGLKWKKAAKTGGKKSTQGKRENLELETRLKSQTVFNYGEWLAFGIKDLRQNDFVMSEESCFKPAGGVSIELTNKKGETVLHVGSRFGRAELIETIRTEFSRYFFGREKPGLKWEEVEEKPTTGTEIANEELASALQGGKKEFTQQEWLACFQVGTLFYDSYIKVNNKYFKQAGQIAADKEFEALLLKTNIDGDTCLHLAAQQDHFQVVKVYLAESPCLIVLFSPLGICRSSVQYLPLTRV